MSIKSRIAKLFRRRPPTQEDLEAQAEAERMHYDIETVRTAVLGEAAENYESGRGSFP